MNDLQQIDHIDPNYVSEHPYGNKQYQYLQNNSLEENIATQYIMEEASSEEVGTHDEGHQYQNYSDMFEEQKGGKKVNFEEGGVYNSSSKSHSF